MKDVTNKTQSYWIHNLFDMFSRVARLVKLCDTSCLHAAMGYTEL